MIGGCCCIVKRKDSAIIGFAVMNIALYTILLLICSKEYGAECRRQQALSEFIEPYRKRYNTYYYPEKPYFPQVSFPNGCQGTLLQALLIACMGLCGIGIIIGILLLVAVTRKIKFLFRMWILFQFLIVLILTITGFYSMAQVSRTTDLTFGIFPYPALFLLSAFPFFMWSLIGVCMSMNGIISGTAEDEHNEQQGKIYGPSDYLSSIQPPSNQQMLPQNGDGDPSQPQYGNNTV